MIELLNIRFKLNYKLIVTHKKQNGWHWKKQMRTKKKEQNAKQKPFHPVCTVVELNGCCENVEIYFIDLT